jgi:hypothetical protein
MKPSARAVRTLALAAFALAAACAAPRAASGPKPAWVDQGTGAFKDADGDVYQGVGVVADVRDRFFAPKRSVDRGQDGIEKIVVAHYCSLLDDFEDSIAVGRSDFTCPPPTPQFGALLKALRDAFVFVGAWNDPADRSTLACYRIKRSAADGLLLRSIDDPKLREFIRARSPAAFEKESARR